MKCVFILKENDELDKIGSDFLEEEKKDIIRHTPSDSPNETFEYTLYKIKGKKDAYILRTTRDLPNKEVWNHEKIKELYEKLKIAYSNEKEPFVIAIHWGVIDEERDGKSECDEITEKLDTTIRKNIILTHYSGKYDSDIISQVNKDGSGLDKVIEKITNRINKDVYIASAQIFYAFKERLLYRLFPLTWDQTLKNDQIKEIGKNVEEVLKEKDKELKSKNAEIGDDILQPISDKISVLFTSLEGQQPPESKKCNKALQDIRANINTLIDAQLKKANKKAIYEQR